MGWVQKFPALSVVRFFTVGCSIVAAVVALSYKAEVVKYEGRRKKNRKSEGGELLKYLLPRQSLDTTVTQADAQMLAASMYALQLQHQLDTWMNFFSNHLLQATSELMKRWYTPSSCSAILVA